MFSFPENQILLHVKVVGVSQKPILLFDSAWMLVKDPLMSHVNTLGEWNFSVDVFYSNANHRTLTL